jgi:mRNA interferase HigB
MGRYCRQSSLAQLRRGSCFFPDADNTRGYVIFNVRHNRYRLITHIHYAKDDPARGSTRGHCYIRSFLTHAEYNNPTNWDKEFGS